MVNAFLLTGIGGMAGSMARLAVGLLLPARNGFPLGTWAVNVCGCLLIGVLMGWQLKSAGASHALRWLLVTGFCGGFTTFSAFSLETVQLLQQGRYGGAAFYAGGSVLCCLVATFAGLYVAKLI